jgi:uncharacterized protein YycO
MEEFCDIAIISVIRTSNIKLIHVFHSKAKGTGRENLVKSLQNIITLYVSKEEKKYRKQTSDFVTEEKELIRVFAILGKEMYGRNQKNLSSQPQNLNYSIVLLQYTERYSKYDLRMTIGNIIT